MKISLFSLCSEIQFENSLEKKKNEQSCINEAVPEQNLYLFHVGDCGILTIPQYHQLLSVLFRNSSGSNRIHSLGLCI